MLAKANVPHRFGAAGHRGRMGQCNLSVWSSILEISYQFSGI